MMSVLVTGSEGRLGRQVVKALAEHHHVISLDITDSGAHDYHRVDILDFEGVRQVVNDADTVVHLAALDFDTHASAIDFVTVNVVGTWNVLQACRESNVRRVVICSSVAATGLHECRPDAPPQTLPVRESHPSIPAEPYGVSKLAIETLSQSVPRDTDIDVMCIRPVAIIFDDEVDRFLAAVDEEASSIFDYVAADDVARAIVLAVDGQWAGYECLFLSAADSAHSQPTLEWFPRLIGPLPMDIDRNRYAQEPRASIISTEHAHRLLGWKPTSNFIEYRDRPAARGGAVANQRS